MNEETPLEKVTLTGSTEDWLNSSVTVVKTRKNTALDISPVKKPNRASVDITNKRFLHIT